MQTVRWLTRSQLGQTLILSGTLLGAAVPTIAVAHAARGWPGGIAAATAFGTCLASGLLSQFLVYLFREPNQLMPRVLLGMFPRMGIPLLVCMVTYLLGGMLVEAGFVYYIMAFYFITLVVETILQAGSAPKPTTESQTG